MEPAKINNCHLPAYRDHPRRFLSNTLVYPVLSRRSEGISVGVNLSPHQRCNFNCIYCQVQRSPASSKDASPICLRLLEDELTRTLESILSGDIYNHPAFRRLPTDLRRLNDIALSGDGEPTAAQEFPAACRLVARIKDQLALDAVEIVLITNSTLLHLPEVRQAIQLLDTHQGRVWAKLDAGTEQSYKIVNGSDVPFRQILENLLLTARDRPILIQTLFMRIDHQRTSPAEVAAYADRLADIINSGGKIAALQLYTIARPPRDPRVTALSNAELDQIAAEISARTNLPIRKYYS